MAVTVIYYYKEVPVSLFISNDKEKMFLIALHNFLKCDAAKETTENQNFQKSKHRKNYIIKDYEK